MTGFTKEYRAVFGVRPICKVLPIASSTYYAKVAVECDPDRASDRARKDVDDREDVTRIYDASGQRYGARKVWHALSREGRCLNGLLQVQPEMNVLQEQMKRPLILLIAAGCAKNHIGRAISEAQ